MPLRVAWNSRQSQYSSVLQYFSISSSASRGGKPWGGVTFGESWAEEVLENYCPGSPGGDVRSLPGGDVRPREPLGVTFAVCLGGDVRSLPGDDVSEISTKINEISRLCLAERSGIGENLNISKVLQHFLISSSASRFGLRFLPHNAKS